MKVYFNNKKITQKEAKELVGAERFKEMVKEAKEEYRRAPYQRNSWFVRNGCLSIDFD